MWISLVANLKLTVRSMLSDQYFAIKFVF